MTNRERFCEAFAHVGHRVMGRELQPFSLRHRFWLEAMESPLVTGGIATMIDLEMASRVCAIPFSRLEMDVPKMLLRGPRWRDKLRFLWLMLRSRTATEYEAMQSYFMDHGCPPATHACAPVTKDGKRYEAMPGILGLVTGLIRGSGGWDPDTVWALTPGAAEWYLVGVFMHRGMDMKIKTEHDEEFEEGLRQMREEKLKAEKLKEEENS